MLAYYVHHQDLWQTHREKFRMALQKAKPLPISRKGLKGSNLN